VAFNDYCEAEGVTYPEVLLLRTAGWADYELLDSGNGAKLERFGRYRFIRPEAQVLWEPRLPAAEWRQAHAEFQPVGEAGGWKYHQRIETRWPMRYGEVRFWAEPTPFRHLGMFPEQCCHWDWAQARLQAAQRPLQVLNLFGYTGVFSLVAAQAGASVTHVDASKKVIAWARENQVLSGLAEKPIRWIEDDAMKFVEREHRRGRTYDAIIIDPPKYGRGPKGETWKIFESLPPLLAACRQILSEQPLFVILTTYAVRISALNLHYLLRETLPAGTTECGELVIQEGSGGREISTSIFARWSGDHA
jgi:23S rRNA (cytosine1962-C5)-methyltransferase